MAKISPGERHAVLETFKLDFLAIKTAFMAQLKLAFAEERKVISEEKEAVDEGQIEAIDAEIKQVQKKLADITAQYSRKISDLRERQKTLRNVPENEWGLPPTGDQLLELKIEAPDWGAPKWNGLDLKTKLDAETAIRLSQKIDVSVPLQAVATIARAVERELTFASSLEKVKEVYDKFYALDFRKYGVDIAPKLDEIKSIGEKTGLGILAAGAVVEEQRMLPPPQEG